MADLDAHQATMPAINDDDASTSTSTSTPSDMDLLFQHAAAIVVWLKERQLDKTLVAFERSLQEELQQKYGCDSASLLSTKPNGQWKWVPQENADVNGGDESDEGDEEESCSGEDESSDSSSEESEESDSSEYETDSEAEDANDEEKDAVRASALGDDAISSEGAKDLSPDTDGDATAIRKNVGRSVSFDESTPNEFFYSPVRKSEKAKTFWTKKELRDIKNDEAMERMASIISNSIMSVPGMSS